MYCFTRKTLVGANRVRIHLLSVKQIVLRVKPFTRKTKILLYFNVLFYRKTNYFTRKTLVGANRVRIHILRLKKRSFYA